MYRTHDFNKTAKMILCILHETIFAVSGTISKVERSEWLSLTPPSSYSHTVSCSSPWRGR